MAARKTPSGGSRPDKIMRDALMLELAEEISIAEGPQKGQKIKKLRLVARSMVNAAIKGDGPVIKEIFDRVDGKVALPLRGDPDGPPIKYETALDDDSKAAIDTLSRFAPEQLAKLTAAELAVLYAEAAGEDEGGQRTPASGRAGNRAVSKGRKVPRK